MSKRLIIKKDRSFYRMEVGVQEGFRIKSEVLYLFSWDYEDTDKLEPGMDVTASVEVTGKGYNSVKTIEEAVLFCCSNCGILTNGDTSSIQCVGCLLPENERLSGEWELTDIIEMLQKPNQEKPYKLYLKQDENKLCLVAFGSKPFYNEMCGVVVGDSVIIDGWRNENRHAFIWKFAKINKSKALKALKRKRLTV